MSDRGAAGSQAGQSGSGSQAEQGNASQANGQQGQEGQGSQEGQAQEPYFNETYMQQGESVEDALARLHGAMETARKQAAGYRQRLNGQGSGSQEGQSGNQSQGNSQQGNSQQGQQGNDTETRIARLEQALQTERQSNAANRTKTQLIEALSNEGAVNAARAVRMIDLDTLDIGEDGTVTDPLGAVRALKADMPQIFQDTRGGGDGGSGNTSGTGQSFNDLIRARAAGQR